MVNVNNALNLLGGGRLQNLEPTAPPQAATVTKFVPEPIQTMAQINTPVNKAKTTVVKTAVGSVVAVPKEAAKPLLAAKAATPVKTVIPPTVAKKTPAPVATKATPVAVKKSTVVKPTATVAEPVLKPSTQVLPSNDTGTLTPIADTLPDAAPNVTVTTTLIKKPWLIFVIMVASVYTLYSKLKKQK